MIRSMRVVIFVSVMVAMQVIMCASSPAQESQAGLFSEDFAEAIRKIHLDPICLHGGFQQIEPYATPLIAEKKDDEAIEYLTRTAITGRVNVSAKLALLVLAKLPDHEVALQTFLKMALSQDLDLRDTVMVGASFLPAEKARAFADSMLKNAPAVETQAKAVNLLGVVGNDDTLDMLKKQAGDEQNTYLRQALERAVAELEFRAALPNDEERAQWDAEQVLYWQAAQDMPNMVTVKGSVFEAAGLLAKQGVEFSASFLRYHIRRGECLATAIAANQKELVLLDDIKRQIMLSGYFGEIACMAIVKMCPEDAPRIFEESLAPDNRMKEVNRDLASFLTQYGDEKTLEFLEKAKSSSDYSFESRKAFMDALDRLAVRIEEEKKRDQLGEGMPALPAMPRMGDKGKFPAPRGIPGPGGSIPK